tara:strand:+ start:277 stop:567 length:291 start_codon:yes stop_codon:yes gene_type:complete
MKFFPFTDDIEKFIETYTILFSLIVLYQGTMGAQSFKPPIIFKELSKSIIFRFISLFSIAFTASKDVEIAFISTCLFSFLIHILYYLEENYKVNDE